MLRRALSSLTAQLLVVFIVATVVPLSLALVEAERAREESEQLAADDAGQAARVGAAQVADLIGGATSVARTLQQTPAFLNGDDAERDSILTLFAQSQPYFSALVFFTSDLQEHGSSNHAPGAPRVDLSPRVYARDAVSTGQVAFTSEPLQALTSRQVILAVAVPMRPAEAAPPAGFLAAGLNVERLPEVWQELPLPRGTSVLLVDTREGRVLTGSGDGSTIVAQTISPANLERIRSNQVGWITTPLRGNQTRLRASSLVQGSPWVVVVDVPQATIQDPAYAEVGRRVLIAVAASGLTLGLLVVLWWRLNHRVTALRSAAAHWARGDWTYRSDMRATDEFGQVGAALDAMAEERLDSERALSAAQTREEEAQVRNLAHLSRIIETQTLVAQQELNDQKLMDLVVDRLPELTGASGAVVELVEADEMVYAAASGTAAQHVGFRLKAEGSFSGLCVRTGRVMLSSDTEEDPRVDREATRAVGVRSMVVAPLNYAGATVGVLKVLSPEPRAFREQQVATLELMAGVLGGALGRAQSYAERARAEAAARASAERLEAVLRAATEVAIIAVGLDGRVTLFNEGAQRMLGYTAAELVGRTPDVILDPNELHARATQRGVPPMEVFVAAARTGGAETDEWTFIRKDSSRLTVSLTVTAMHGGAGRLVGFIGMATDITERKAVEQMKDQFVSMVSHELRTPLTSIRGSLGLMAGGVLGPIPERGQRMLDIAVDNTERLLRLINDILDLERMQSGRIEMEKVPTDLGPLMTQSAETMRAMAESAEVSLDVQPLTANLCADPDRMIQVLTNLLSNAIKFSESGGDVCLRAMRCNTERLRIEVCDRGRGIPADKIERIFERFQQVHASDSRQKGGTGLGLAICRAIVEQHGGRIWAESTFGVGTTMVVEMPTLEAA